MFGLLGVVFVAFKLLGIITWSWWWVTAPFWGGFALVMAIFLTVLFGAVIVSFLAALIDHMLSKKGKTNGKVSKPRCV